MPIVTDSEAKRSTEAGRPSLAASAQPRKGAYPDPSADGPMVDAGSLRILVVDDDPNILNLVAKMVTRLGHHPTVAEDGMHALLYLGEAHHHLVITDYKMPFMDGYQLAARIKARYCGTRVIVMTGHCEEEITPKLNRSRGADAFLLKPFNLNTLNEKITSLDYRQGDAIRFVTKWGG